VDVPGFGYAKVSKKDRVKWMKVTKQYLDSRTNLMCVMMLVDSRIPAQKVDLEFMAWMGGVGLPFVLVFTKVDKLNKAERAAFLPAYEQVMLKHWHKMPPLFVTSGNTGEGREEVLRFIASTNGLYQP
jgi:GTP-binding protein